MNEVMAQIPRSQILAMKDIFNSAGENARLLLEKHDQDLGRDTVLNKTIAEMYEKQIAEAEWGYDLLKDHGVLIGCIE